MKIFSSNGSRAGRTAKSSALIIALALILVLAVGGTVAYIFTHTGPVINTFTPADAKITVNEEISSNQKTSITVVNNSTGVPVYIRVKLVSNIQDNHDNVLGAAPLGEISLGKDWIDGRDGCYYYKNVVAVGDSTSNLLAEGANITLTEGQVVEVLAEGIQAMPKQAVIDAWGQTIADQLN